MTKNLLSPLLLSAALLLHTTLASQPSDGPRRAPLDALRSCVGKKTGAAFLDVHGAGAQRSDPKVGSPDHFTGGRGPQGDVVRIYNFARCVKRRPGAGATLPYAIPDTGQSKCYSSSGEASCQKDPGQDGAYTTVPMSFRQNDDGTITDLITGLIWLKDFIKSDKTQADTLASANRTGGFQDWRVPTIKELYSLIDFSGTTGRAPPEASRAPKDARPYLPSIFHFEYPRTNRYIDAQYISGTLARGRIMGGRMPAFYGVNFADGRIKSYPVSPRNGEKYYLRLVRGNPEYGKNQFKVQPDGTILDQASGLLWTRYDSGAPQMQKSLKSAKFKDGRLDWREALAFCENLNFAGQADWKLPDAKELQSIVQYERVRADNSAPALAEIFQISSIKNEVGQSDYPFFWSSTTHLDGPAPGEFAVYFAFGQAPGFMRPPR